MDGPVDLLRGGVPPAAAELAEDHQPLRGDALTTRAEQGDQVVGVVYSHCH